MKTPPSSHFLRLLLLGLFLAATVSAMPALAQESSEFFTVDGTVRDARSGRPLPGAGVSVPDTPIGTVTNTDGTFSIKIRYDLGARELEFSHLGYRTSRLAVENRDQTGLRVTLSAEAIEMPGVRVVDQEARNIVDEAVRRIGTNYSDRTNLLTGFYRETIQKRSNYIDISEAVVEIFRTSYANEPYSDRLRVVKGRRLVSPRAGDMLAVKLQGGPNIYLQGDVVKNRDFLLSPESLNDYRFWLEAPVMIDDRPHYTVAFEPQVVFSEYALLSGRLYIDRTSLTISRAEYAYEMSNPLKVTSMILRRKPASLRFHPQEVSYVLSYRQREGRSYLYYIGVKFRFRCDWRRRLFATGYTILSETVITDGRDEGFEQIPARESFRNNYSLSDRVDYFQGPEFWEDYNIIAPTESLENAVDRLKRRNETAASTRD